MLALFAGVARADAGDDASQALNTAYANLVEAVKAGVDEYDAIDMEEARNRYNTGYSLLKTNPAQARRLAEQAQLLGERAIARTHASLAAQQLQAARDEVDTLEQMAIPKKEDIQPGRTVRNRRRGS